MARLHQLIPVVSTRKSGAERALTEAYKLEQKPEPFLGTLRTYQPDEDGGETAPPETKYVQATVKKLYEGLHSVWRDLFDGVASLDASNQVAMADLVVDGVTLAKNVPSTNLLFLEKKLTDIGTFISKMPVLDPSERWTFDDNMQCYRSEPKQTNRTKKVPKTITLASATAEHPAQAQLVHEDVKVGVWTTTLLHGGVPMAVRADMLERTRKLLEAVRSAREKANQVDVVDLKTGDAVLKYVFGPLGA